jgi:hypothetical protein
LALRVNRGRRPRSGENWRRLEAGSRVKRESHRRKLPQRAWTSPGEEGVLVRAPQVDLSLQLPLGQALLDQDAPLGEKPHPLKDQGDGGGLLRHLYPFTGKVPGAGLRNGQASPEDLGVAGQVVGALLLVEEEALHVQEAILQVVLGVGEGKPSVARQAQGKRVPSASACPRRRATP